MTTVASTPAALTILKTASTPTPILGTPFNFQIVVSKQVADHAGWAGYESQLMRVGMRQGAAFQQRLRANRLRLALYHVLVRASPPQPPHEEQEQRTDAGQGKRHRVLGNRRAGGQLVMSALQRLQGSGQL